MSAPFDPGRDIKLYVEGRIKPEEAARQARTAVEIVARLKKQPGLILADEVGMGKTFVALASAATMHFTDPERRPVVVMVPSSLAEKWPRDADVFRKKCLSAPWSEQFRFPERPITRGTDFLKTLDDDVAKRNSVVFVTHDLSEAITLADRIVVLTRRPGRIKMIHEVKLPRPRDVIKLRETDEYAQEYSQIWHVLGEEFAEHAR